MRNIAAGAVGGVIAGALVSGVMLGGRKAGLLHKTLGEQAEGWLDRDLDSRRHPGETGRSWPGRRSTSRGRGRPGRRSARFTGGADADRRTGERPVRRRRLASPRRRCHKKGGQAGTQ